MRRQNVLGSSDFVLSGTVGVNPSFLSPKMKFGSETSVIYSKLKLKRMEINQSGPNSDLESDCSSNRGSDPDFNPESDPGSDDAEENLKNLMKDWIKWYRITLSPIMPPNCRYVPSCSNYALQAIEEFGPWKGGILTSWRILRCNPLGSSGFDPPVWPPPGLSFLTVIWK